MCTIVIFRSIVLSCGMVYMICGLVKYVIWPVMLYCMVCGMA